MAVANEAPCRWLGYRGWSPLEWDEAQPKNLHADRVLMTCNFYLMDYLYGSRNLYSGQNWASGFSMRMSIYFYSGYLDFESCPSRLVWICMVWFDLASCIRDDLIILRYSSMGFASYIFGITFIYLYIYIQAWLLFKGIQFSTDHWNDPVLPSVCVCACVTEQYNIIM